VSKPASTKRWRSPDAVGSEIGLRHRLLLAWMAPRPRPAPIVGTALGRPAAPGTLPPGATARCFAV